jgi:plastocyanin
VVSVSTSGLITAIGNGGATVYAGVTGDMPASLGVTAPTFAKVVVSPASASIATSATQTFTAQGQDSNGTAIPGLPSAAWQSSNTNIATIATIGMSTGVATGVMSGGPIAIMATISTKSGTAQLTVTAASTLHTIPWQRFTVQNLTVPVGDSIQWQSTDGLFHTSTSCTAGSMGCASTSSFVWDTGSFNTTSTAIKFTQTGAFPYCCTPHGCGSMSGTITVQ